MITTLAVPITGPWEECYCLEIYPDDRGCPIARTVPRAGSRRTQGLTVVLWVLNSPGLYVVGDSRTKKQTRLAVYRAEGIPLTVRELTQKEVKAIAHSLPSRLVRTATRNR